MRLFSVKIFLSKGTKLKVEAADQKFTIEKRLVPEKETQAPCKAYTKELEKAFDKQFGSTSFKDGNKMLLRQAVQGRYKELKKGVSQYQITPNACRH